MATPVRKLVRETIQRRLENEAQSKESLEKLKDKISDCFKNMESRIVVVENANGGVDEYLEVALKRKVIDPNFGPLDGFKIIFDKFCFKVHFFTELLEEGTVIDVECVANLRILQKLNSSSACVCLGISEYSEYRQRIGFDSKNVVQVSLPSNTVRHVNCEQLCKPKANVLKTFGCCEPCSSLKWYLMRLKRKHDPEAAPKDHDTSQSLPYHQQSSSVIPFDFLSPKSKKARMVNVKKENKVLKVKLARLRTQMESNALAVNDDQSKEITELVTAITSTEAGQRELEKIFDEVVKIGRLLRSIWDSDTADFYHDQIVNG